MSEALLPSFLPAPGHQINRLSFPVALIFRQTTSVAADRQEILFSLSFSHRRRRKYWIRKQNQSRACILALGRFPKNVMMIFDIGKSYIST